MNKKLILSSLAVLGLVSPALAEPFPSTGYMQENMTYENAATFENMGVYEDMVTAIAEYTNNMYTLEPGYYLQGNSENQLECPANSYCPGGYDVEYSEHDQGIERCPMAYPFADGGSSSVSATQCYKPCDVYLFQNAETLVSGGRDYYSSGADTCRISSCKQGYQPESGVNITGEHFKALIGNKSGSPDNGYGWWKVDFGETGGYLSGNARCSSQGGNFSERFDDVVEDGGTYCFCNITEHDSYMRPPRFINSKWQYLTGTSGSGNCVNECAGICAETMGSTESNNLAFRQALLSSITYVSDTCVPNTININWDGADTEDIEANKAWSVEYGGDIRTPRKATPVPGKTFKGWRFEKVSQ